jgi:serine/threonine protein phosphatase PrpC
MSEQKERWWRRFLGRVTSGAPHDQMGGGTGPLRIRAAGDTDVGREREQNEDGFACLEEQGVFIVADGMGGEAAGEEASRLVVEVLTNRLTRESIAETLSAGPGLEPLFRQAIEEANEAVVRTGRSHPGWERMGSTVVVAVVHEGVVFLSNVGDSRAYLVRAGKAAPLTRDHTSVAALVEAGYLRPEEARTHPNRSELSQCVGMNRLLRPDYSALRLMVGDRILLCSDGLWEMVSDEEIGRLVAQHPEPEAAVRALIEAANRAGGYDNITVIVIAAERGEEGGEAQLQAWREERITEDFTIEEPPEPEKEREVETVSASAGRRSADG